MNMNLSSSVIAMMMSSVSSPEDLLSKASPTDAMTLLPFLSDDAILGFLLRDELPAPLEQGFNNMMACDKLSKGKLILEQRLQSSCSEGVQAIAILPWIMAYGLDNVREVVDKVCSSVSPVSDQAIKNLSSVSSLLLSDESRESAWSAICMATEISVLPYVKQEALQNFMESSSWIPSDEFFSRVSNSVRKYKDGGTLYECAKAILDSQPIVDAFRLKRDHLQDSVAKPRSGL